MTDKPRLQLPRITVAAVVPDGDRYLLVEEMTAEGLKLNNPAGHLDPGESPEQEEPAEHPHDELRARRAARVGGAPRPVE